MAGRPVSLLMAISIVAGLLLAPLRAQEPGAPGAPGALPADPALWQEAITGQVEAFRAGEDAIALFYAGAYFRRAYTNPANFVRSIRMQGYAPIIESVSHSFGTYEVVGEDGVLQIVDFMGRDLHAYRALYQLGLEAEGWKVQGVMLREMPGVNI